LPLSTSRFLGNVAKHHRHAVEQAVADINRAGGPFGRTIELTVEDSELDLKKAKKAFDSLVDAGVVGFAGPVVSDISLALSERLASEGVIAVSPSSTHPALASAGAANETKEVVGDIEHRIDTVREHAELTADGIRKTRDAISDGTEMVHEAQESLREIVNNVEETSVGVSEINDVPYDQAATTEEVVAVMDEVTRISEETAAEAEEVAAATGEQTASLSEVSRSAESLARQAESLAATVDSFHVGSPADSNDEA
jgi:hypothetical protein